MRIVLLANIFFLIGQIELFVDLGEQFMVIAEVKQGVIIIMNKKYLSEKSIIYGRCTYNTIQHIFLFFYLTCFIFGGSVFGKKQSC